MSHAVYVTPAIAKETGRVLPEPGDQSIRTDAVYVVYTSFDETLKGVRVAGGFAKALDVPVSLVYLRKVPFAVPVDAPSGMAPVETKAFIDCLRAEGVEVQVRVYLCRDKRRATGLALPRHSLVVVAGHRRPWPTEAGRWRRRLEGAGYFVVFVDTSKPGSAPASERGSSEREAATQERPHA